MMRVKRCWRWTSNRGEMRSQYFRPCGVNTPRSQSPRCLRAAASVHGALSRLASRTLRLGTRGWSSAMRKAHASSRSTSLLISSRSGKPRLSTMGRALRESGSPCPDTVDHGGHGQRSPGMRRTRRTQSGSLHFSTEIANSDRCLPAGRLTSAGTLRCCAITTSHGHPDHSPFSSLSAASMRKQSGDLRTPSNTHLNHP